MTQLNSEYLMELYKKITEIHAASLQLGAQQPQNELITVIDHLSRVAGFLVDLRLQELESGSIASVNPTGYLDSKIGIANTVMKRYQENVLSY
ncbi:hypothetical protein [Brevibacillus nitrificans]|uniref:hypothetical protein n=1 Tax=Brevibacillus nitrificans TaxID=651560 RepID=UPI002860A642|nr:hypothetical protein [Brevibacillus nitrificans]MDR7316290.1 hypothetical protein [Brevibacillus nitrificans]